MKTGKRNETTDNTTKGSDTKHWGHGKNLLCVLYNSASWCSKMIKKSKYFRKNESG